MQAYLYKATGAHVKRPDLTKCLKALAEGDALIVWKLDRLGRSLRDLIGLLEDLKARRVAFRSLTEAIDTTTPTGRAMWQMVGILAELERLLIQERTKAGRAAGTGNAVAPGTCTTKARAHQAVNSAGAAGGRPGRLVVARGARCVVLIPTIEPLALGAVRSPWPVRFS